MRVVFGGVVSIIMAGQTTAGLYQDAVLADQPILYYNFTSTNRQLEAGIVSPNLGTASSDYTLKVQAGSVNTQTGYRFVDGRGEDTGDSFAARSDTTTIVESQDATNLFGDLLGSSGLTTEFFIDFDELGRNSNPADNGGSVFSLGYSFRFGTSFFDVAVDGTGLVSVQAQTNDSSSSSRTASLTPSDLALSGPHHIAVSLDFAGDSVAFIVDGVLAKQVGVSFADDTFDVTPPSNTLALIGGGPSGFFPGSSSAAARLDEFALYGRALTESEVFIHLVPEPASLLCVVLGSIGLLRRGPGEPCRA
ncbi:MAG: LamG-like jellyroll fold domain-containing protein [Planctomycetota bacterium]